MQLTDNTIFITGGNSGIGRGLAEALHQRGNKVIISGRRRDRLDEVIAANPGMEAVELDITDPANIQAVAAQLVEAHPKLNVLINNAGIMVPDNIAVPVDDAVLMNQVTTNLIGSIRMSSALVEHLKRQPRATIVYNSSVVAYVPMAMFGVYSATKAAIHSYALSQRFMLRDSSVRVQEIAPPWVGTELLGAVDTRAMPLDNFIAGTIEALGTDAEEVLVEEARGMRNNPGPGEHAFVNGFNAQLLATFSAAA